MKEEQLQKKKNNFKKLRTTSVETYQKLEMAAECYVGEKKRLSDTQFDTNG